MDVVVLRINHPSVILGTERAGNVGKWATSNEFAAQERVRTPPDEEKSNLYAFEVDDSLVALLEVNKFNQVAARDVIWWHQKREFDTGSAISSPRLTSDRHTIRWRWRKSHKST